MNKKLQFCFLLLVLFGASSFSVAKGLDSPSGVSNVEEDSIILVKGDDAVFSKDSIFSSQIVQSTHKGLGQIYVEKGTSVFGKSSLCVDAIIYHQGKEKKQQIVTKTKKAKIHKKQVQKIPPQDKPKDNFIACKSEHKKSFFVFQKINGIISINPSSSQNGFISHLNLASPSNRIFFNLSIKSIITINSTNSQKIGLKISRPPPPFLSFV